MLARSGDRERDHRAIADRARAEGAVRIVVGFPLSLSGREGPAAEAVRTEVAELREVAGPDLPVELHDERLTTVTAERALVDARVSRSDRRAVRDAVAAAVMLQSYLERPA